MRLRADIHEPIHMNRLSLPWSVWNWLRRRLRSALREVAFAGLACGSDWRLCSKGDCGPAGWNPGRCGAALEAGQALDSGLAGVQADEHSGLDPQTNGMQQVPAFGVRLESSPKGQGGPRSLLASYNKFSWRYTTSLRSRCWCTRQPPARIGMSGELEDDCRSHRRIRGREGHVSRLRADGSPKHCLGRGLHPVGIATIVDVRAPSECSTRRHPTDFFLAAISLRSSNATMQSPRNRTGLPSLLHYGHPWAVSV